ncbi:MAG TPA: XrtA system polysaccharide deacetylase [Terriglobales bacterium]|jgi:polysaccharide deacetylase family protein (PEP-CTERM system associated)
MATAPSSPAIAISIDLEEYFQVEVMNGVVERAQWEAMPARAEAATDRLLAAFAEAGARATFFAVGWLAERQPQLLRRITAAGHELGCHSYWHRPVFRLTPDEFAQDTRRAVAALADAAGVAVRGYRAPNFSLRCDGSMDWAFDTLAANGFTYDSSVHPIRHPFYGAPRAPRLPFPLANGMWEFPMATVAVGARRLPMAGGGFWRLAPLAYTRWGLRQALRQGLQPVCYLHPWELDPGQPRQALARRQRLRHYTGLAGMEAKLRRLLRDFRCLPLADLYAQQLHGREAALVAGGASA